MTAMDYSVRLNTSDGLLEVTGPEREWVDAKVEQLTPLLSGGGGDGAREPKRTTRRRAARQKTPDTETEDSGQPTRRPRTAGGKPEINTDLREQLTPEVKKQFQAYIDARRKAWDGSQSAQAAIIATFLQDELDHNGVDPHDLYTVYTDLGERSPRNLRSQLVNARQRARYFAGGGGGKLVLSHNGENFARFDALDGEADES